MENQVTNNNDEIEIDLGEIFHLILSRLGLIILSGIILGVISIIGTMLFITPQYESTTKIMVLNKQDSNMQTSTQLTKDYAELIKSRTVLEGVIAQLNLNITYQQLLGKLTVDTSTDSRIVTIIVSDEDPYTASEMANAIRDMAAEHIQSVMDIEAVNVVDSANIPSEKASPSLAKNGVIGGLLGVIIAMAIVIIIYLTNDTIKVEEDVERYLGLSVLGSIPYSEKESRSKKQKSRKRR